MSYIMWKDSFNIGTKEMDEQHTIFVGYINDLYDAMQTGDAKTVVEPILTKLTDYIQLHFAAEERLLKANNYPMLEEQQNHHKYFISELNFMKSSFLNKTQTAQNLLLFLKDWFLHHILSEDLKYVGFVNN
jgi:hemerythrin